MSLIPPDNQVNRKKFAMEALNSNLFKFNVQQNESGSESGSDYDSGSESPNAFENLPVEVVRRVLALEHLQDKRAQIEVLFKQELAVLEKKYEDMYAPIYEDRAKIINGEREVTEEEYKDREASHVALVDAAPAPAGIPRFWLDVLKRSQVSSLVFEDDEEALTYLRDIKTERFIDPVAPKLVVSFDFAPNPFFTNASLTKTVVFNANGDGVTAVIACPIEWKEGKNLCVKTVLQKVRHRTKPGVTATKEKQEEADSFFHFFDESSADACCAHDQDDEEHDHDHDADGKMMADAEICSFFDRYIVPAAVDWYTYKAVDFEDDGSDYDYEDDDEEDEEESD